MGVLEFKDTHASKVPAPKLFKAWFVDVDTLLPVVAPDQVKSVDLLQGTGGPGSIKQVNFTEAVPIKYVKYTIDALDEKKLTYADTVIEGGEISDKVEKVTHEIKIMSTAYGGSFVNFITKFYTKEDATLTEEELQASKEGALGLVKAVEAHLLAN